MDSPVDVQQIVSALVFWAAAFSMAVWISHGTGLCGRARRRTVPRVPGHRLPAS